MQMGIVLGGAAFLPFSAPFAWARPGDDDDDDDGGDNSGSGGGGDDADDDLGATFDFQPFSAPLTKPPVLQPTTLSPAPGSADALVGSDAVYHGIAPEHDPNHPDHAPDWDRSEEVHYAVSMDEVFHEFIPGIQTPAYGYNGMVPGPTFIFRQQEPVVTRFTNNLPCEASVHVHGGHHPAHSDGYPDFYTLQNRARDYYYPNIAPRLNASPEGGGTSGEFDLGCWQSTMWYHDHGMDVTGFNVSRGLAGFALMVDDLEQELIDSNVLPATYGEFDIPIVIQDQSFNADGTLAYDFFDHNGRIGNIFTVNGKAQPYVTVKRQKYRIRILNGSNARYYQLRLNGQTGRRVRDGQPFLVIGKDAWLLPEADYADNFLISPSERFDVVIDFTHAPDRVYLQNIMDQDKGRKPNGVDPDKEHTPLLEFRVEGEATSEDFTVSAGTELRPTTPIDESEIEATRHFEMGRRHGAWVINDLLFSPRRSDATPLRNSTERWIFKNGGGGWWHPMHIHLEGFFINRIDDTPREALPFYLKGRNGTVNLEGGTEVELFVKFRTFKGPFVTHCHLVEHEDMRMMMAFDPRDAGESSFLNGVESHASTPARQQISGMPIVPSEDELCFETEAESFAGEQIGPGDVDRLEGRGVGIPHSDYDPEGLHPSPGAPFPEEQLDD